MRSMKLMFGLAAVAAVSVALPTAAHAETAKSGECEGFDFNNTLIGENWSMSGSELIAGEVLHLTSNESDSRPGFITLRIESGGDTVETTLPFGGSADLTAVFSGSSVVRVISSDGEIHRVTSTCDAAPDTDNDTVADADDNCPTVANTDQVDTDANETGDACEASALPTAGSAPAAMVWLAAGLAVLGTGSVLVARRRSVA